MFPRYVMRYGSDMAQSPATPPKQQESATLAELRAASRDVDRTLIAWSLSLSPLQRARAATKALKALNRYSRHAPSRG